tara:strand:- start:34657 stop:35784 length:1128 start_codon:yes stop_codon:yes gene_type:complete
MEKFNNPIPYMKHQILDEDISIVTEVLKSEYLTQGPYVQQVEESMAKLTKRKFGVMCSNGTAALHLVAEMLNQRTKLKEKNIITTSFTFVADANFGRYIDAEIRLADINRKTWTIDPLSIEKLIDKNTLAVVAPHYAGIMCDMELIKKICKEKNVYLVEDACHAPNASLNGKVSGSYGDVSTFSFHATKHIAAGEGGIICTDSPEESEKLETLRSHGLPHWSKRTGFGYDINEIAFNYRPSEVSGALAYAHIQRIDELINSRVKIANKYNEALNWEFYEKQMIPPGYTHVYHLYPILLPENKLRDKCLDYLKDANIFGQIHYPPISKMTGFKKYNSKNPVSEDISSRVISVPMFPQLTKQEQEFVIEKLNEFSKN